MLNNSSEFALEPSALAIAVVDDIATDGRIRASSRDRSTSLTCRVLHPVGGIAKLPHPGDEVLVWVVPGAGEGVILGALEPPTVDEASTELPNELVIEASESLKLRVGDGSITIRADGKILIKGKDLVSQAKNTNRIKGGAVAIN